MRKFVRLPLLVVNEEEYNAQVAAKRVPEVFGGLLLLLSQVADEAAKGSNTWLSLGKTQDGSALALTVHTPEGNLSGYAGTLGGLALEASKLL